MKLKSIIQSAIACSSILFLASCASITNTPNEPVSATVEIEQWSAAYYGSATTGDGTIHYRGKPHRFSITSIGAGGAGAQKVSATGVVYGLKKLSDFSGTYTGVSSGLTAFKGRMHAKLTNPNGVSLYIAGTTEGLASSLGVQAFKLQLLD